MRWVPNLPSRLVELSNSLIQGDAWPAFRFGKRRYQVVGFRVSTPTNRTLRIDFHATDGAGTVWLGGDATNLLFGPASWTAMDGEVRRSFVDACLRTLPPDYQARAISVIEPDTSQGPSASPAHGPACLEVRVRRVSAFHVAAREASVHVHARWGVLEALVRPRGISGHRPGRRGPLGRPGHEAGAKSEAGICGQTHAPIRRSISCVLRVLAGWQSLSRRQFASLETGQVVMLNGPSGRPLRKAAARAQSHAYLELAGRLLFEAAIDEQGGICCHTVSTKLSRTKLMNDDTRHAQDPAEEEVALSFRIASLPVTLDELRKVAPGYVFTSPVGLATAEVVVYLGEQSVGRGRIVAVGEMIGVEITAWGNAG